MTEKEINNLILQEDLNDGYLPISGDFVRPLPFVSSNKIDWQVGVVRAIFESGVTSECSIHTNTGYNIVEYCNYLIPVLTATN